MALCALDADAAAGLWQGLNEIARSFARFNDPAGPAARHKTALTELFEVASLGREANPDAELHQLGIEHIAGAVPDSPDDLPVGSTQDAEGRKATTISDR